MAARPKRTARGTGQAESQQSTDKATGQATGQRKPIAKKASFPGFVQPALATLKAKPPVGMNWLHEIKFDGYRLQAHIRSGRIKLLTRSGLDWTAKFGSTLADALKSLPVRDGIFDGEVVVEGVGMAPDFSALQDALATGQTQRLVLYAFDLLYLDGRDLRPVPLIQRKLALAAIVTSTDAVRYSEHFLDDGERVLRHACRLGLEGVVSKLQDAPYRSGRGKDWIKAKCSQRQEFVIAGYVLSSVLPKAIGSLVLGYFSDGKLIYAGRVGTGFSNKVAADLYRGLEALSVPRSPFAERLSSADARGVRFAHPKLVGEVELRGWTGDGLVRHASFRGLRDDKAAEEVVLESRNA